MPITRVVDMRLEPFSVRIDRASKWGNPYSHLAGTKAVYRVKSVEEACDRYDEYLEGRPDLLAALSELDGQVLGCWCKPHHACAGPACWCKTAHPCHGDRLIRRINALKRSA